MEQTFRSFALPIWHTYLLVHKLSARSPCMARSLIRSSLSGLESASGRSIASTCETQQIVNRVEIVCGMARH